MKKMKKADVVAELKKMPGWSLKAGKLHREYKFPDFPHAIGMMTTAAPGIEKMNHHPEWFNVYNQVKVDLSTHDVGGITHKDFELAALLEGIAKKLA